MRLRRSQVQEKNVVFGYDPDTNKLALIKQSLVTQPRFGRYITVGGIAVTKRIHFANSGRVINDTTRRFWFMLFPEEHQSFFGGNAYQWCDAKGSIDALALNIREKQLLREARAAARVFAKSQRERVL